MNPPMLKQAPPFLGGSYYSRGGSRRSAFCSPIYAPKASPSASASPYTSSLISQILLLEGDKRNQEREYTDAFSETFFRHAIARGSQLEQDLETVITVLQPGPLGILEHKFSAAEVQEAKAIVQSAVENWRRNSAFERNGRVWQQSKSATSQE